MAESLPYLASPGSITKCLERISNAATPEKVTGDFINTKLSIKGGSGRALVPFLKKIGFVNSDGTPSDLYKRHRNPSESGVAVAKAVRIGYRPLYEVNEYSHELNDAELKGLIVQVTGQDPKSSVVQQTLYTFNNLKKFADFDTEAVEVSPRETEKLQVPVQIHGSGYQKAEEGSRQLGMNLSYTINLNLPATSDIAVFNAIFKSLRENLLDTDE